VGQHADGPRAAKGKLAFKFFIEKLGLYALNTLSPQENNNFTHWDVHDPTVENSVLFPPRQIDFLFGTKILAAVSRAMAINSDATDSDHRPIVCKIPYPLTAEARALKKARAKKKVYEKPKPLNWYLTDPMYNFSICEELGLEIDDKLDGGLSSNDQVVAYHTYTDGSFLRGQGAGWAFSVFNRGDATGEGKPFLTAAGPIVTLRKSIFFCWGGAAYFRGGGN
jgi:hypothetical protein